MSVTREQITEALRDVFDPELGMSVVDLGLIYDATIDGPDRRSRVQVGPSICPGSAAYTGIARRASICPGSAVLALRDGPESRYEPPFVLILLRGWCEAGEPRRRGPIEARV